MEQARNALDKGKAREAIDALKLAGKLDKNATIRPLLYRAYLLQLAMKGCHRFVNSITSVISLFDSGIPIAQKALPAETGRC